MKYTLQFIYACLLLAVAGLTGCSKQSDPKPEPTPEPYYVSGDYLCRDSTRNKIWTNDPPDYFFIVFYDSVYTQHVVYLDTALNIITFNGKEYTLDNNNTCLVKHSGLNGTTFDSLNLSGNKLFYMRRNNVAGSAIYTKMTGTRVK